MATPPDAIYTALDKELFQAGDYVFEDVLDEQILQNVQHLLLEHDHDGADGNGGALPTANPVYLMYIGPAVG